MRGGLPEGNPAGVHRRAQPRPDPGRLPSPPGAAGRRRRAAASGSRGGVANEILATREVSVMSTTDEGSVVAELREELTAFRRNWLWFVLLGAALIFVGFIALGS